MGLPLFQVDAFTNQPFAGNPAAVCVLDEPREDAWMQNVAREMNLSETAFLVKQDDGYSLRWFTPAVEVDLCGHATLASAHILWERGYLAAASQARFHTRSGLLTADQDNDWIELNFPAQPEQPTNIPGLAEALGVTPLYTGKSQFDVLVEVESEAVVRDLRPDLTHLLRQLHTIHMARHDHIRQQQIDTRLMLDALQCTCRIFSPQHTVAHIRQIAGGDVEQVRLIIDNQCNRAVRSPVTRLYADTGAPLRNHIFSHDWQEQGHGSAYPLLAVDFHAATRLPRKSVDHRQAQTGALAPLLGREERLEHALDQFIRDAVAGIGDLDAYVAPRLDLTGAHGREPGAE